MLLTFRHQKWPSCTLTCFFFYIIYSIGTTRVFYVIQTPDVPSSSTFVQVPRCPSAWCIREVVIVSLDGNSRVVPIHIWLSTTSHVLWPLDFWLPKLNISNQRITRKDWTVLPDEIDFVVLFLNVQFVYILIENYRCNMFPIYTTLFYVACKP